MPLPKEICLEELTVNETDERFVRCVALPGAEPGLALDREGALLWMPEGPVAYGLCVSADGRLVLLRAEGTEPISVERGRRSLVAPVGQPVFLLDQDLLRLGDRSLCVHIHGDTEAVYAPERLTASALGRLVRAAAAAAALALGSASAMAAGGSGGVPGGSQGTPPLTASTEPVPIEVRTRPPVVVPPRKAVSCVITRQKGSAKGPLTIHATCPHPQGLRVGLSGALVETKTGKHVKDGAVKVVSLSDKTLVAQAELLRKPVPNAELRFWVYR